MILQHAHRAITPTMEPRRLVWRHLTTNPRALYLLLNRDRSTDINGTHNP
jgi:hypothetical protein